MPLSVLMKFVNLLAVTVPLIGTILAIVLLWDWGVGWLEVGLLLGMYSVTMLGVTIGYHRMFSHRSFDTGPTIQFLLAAVASMAAQGRLFQWVATHRRHHQFSDCPEDPHSPHHQGVGIVGLFRGICHAHIGWMFTAVPPNMARYVRDLRRQRLLRISDALFPVWVFVGFGIPTLVGGLVSGTWTGAFLGFLWGGLVRICLVHHVTWSINSVCHLWGRCPHPGTDHSRNNLVFGILAMGEGWHNNHHAYPVSARHGFGWQCDISYYIIRAMWGLGLVWKVRLPVRGTI